MVGFEGGKPEERTYQPAHIAARNARYGLLLLVIYVVLYGAFVLINTFWPALMDWVPAAGINLAIWYGLGLIVAALLLALAYSWMCRADVPERPEGRS